MSNEIPRDDAFIFVAAAVLLNVRAILSTPIFFLASSLSLRSSVAVHSRRTAFFFLAIFRFQDLKEPLFNNSPEVRKRCRRTSSCGLYVSHESVVGRACTVHVRPCDDSTLGVSLNSHGLSHKNFWSISSPKYHQSACIGPLPQGGNILHHRNRFRRDESVI